MTFESLSSGAFQKNTKLQLDKLRSSMVEQEGYPTEQSDMNSEQIQLASESKSPGKEQQEKIIRATLTRMQKAVSELKRAVPVALSQSPEARRYALSLNRTYAYACLNTLSNLPKNARFDSLTREGLMKDLNLVIQSINVGIAATKVSVQPKQTRPLGKPASPSVDSTQTYDPSRPPPVERATEQFEIGQLYSYLTPELFNQYYPDFHDAMETLHTQSCSLPNKDNDHIELSKQQTDALLVFIDAYLKHVKSGIPDASMGIENISVAIPGEGAANTLHIGKKFTLRIHRQQEFKNTSPLQPAYQIPEGNTYLYHIQGLIPIVPKVGESEDPKESKRALWSIRVNAAQAK